MKLTNSMPYPIYDIKEDNDLYTATVRPQLCSSINASSSWVSNTCGLILEPAHGLVLHNLLLQLSWPGSGSAGSCSSCSAPVVVSCSGH